MNHIIIKSEQCKGCRLCVELCPKKCIIISSTMNKMGYQHAEFRSELCTACGICYHICPEPGAIIVIEDKEAPQNV